MSDNLQSVPERPGRIVQELESNQSFGVTVSRLDAQVHLDLGAAGPQYRRVYGLPITLSMLTPLLALDARQWEVESTVPREGVSEAKDAVRPMGAPTASIYLTDQEALLGPCREFATALNKFRASEAPLTPTTPDAPDSTGSSTASKSKVKLSKLKLFFATYLYYRSGMISPEAKDTIELLLDKVLLAVLIHPLYETTKSIMRDQFYHGATVPLLAAFDDELLRRFASEYSELTHPERMAAALAHGQLLLGLRQAQLADDDEKAACQDILQRLAWLTEQDDLDLDDDLADLLRRTIAAMGVSGGTHDDLLGTPTEPSQTILPVYVLDLILSRHLSKWYEDRKYEKTSSESDSSSKRKWMRYWSWDVNHLVETAIGGGLIEPSQRRKDYGFFYPIVHRYWSDVMKVKNKAEEINFFKLRYSQRIPSLPYIEEIDMRPAYWTSDLNALSMELNLVAAQRQAALQRLNGQLGTQNTEDLQAAMREAGTANARIATIRRDLDLLRQQIEAAGFKLKASSGYLPALTEDNQRYSLVQEVKVSRQVVVPRRETRTEIVNTTVAVATKTQKSFDPLVLVHPVLPFLLKAGSRKDDAALARIQIARPVERTVEWFETITLTETVEIPVAEQDPLREYLGRTLHPSAHPFPIADYRGDDYDTLRAKYEQSVMLPIMGKEMSDLFDKVNADVKGTWPKYSGIEYKVVVKSRNADKDVRMLTLHENGYRDQHGNSLERLLAEAEDPVRRAKLLLLVPVHGRGLDGTPRIEKYLAVHNPVAPRPSQIAPRLFLVETYRHELGQVPGHWLGALSHTVCLFPGEVRRLKLTAEVRSSSRRTEEQRSTRRTTTEARTSVHSQVRSDLSDMKKNGKESSWNINASGGVNAAFYRVSASASKSEKSTDSSEQLAKRIDDRVADSMQSISQANEVQFAVTAESSQSQSVTQEQVIEFQNINHGRAVTHKFFQLLHQYRTSLWLEDARIVIEYGEPLIPGVPIYHTEVVRLSELSRLFSELPEEERQRVQVTVKSLVAGRLAQVRSLSKTAAEASSVEMVGLPMLLTESRHFVNSGAYFLESEVAATPATEPYVEQMRHAEVAEKEAHVARLLAEVDAVRAGKQVAGPRSATNSEG